MGWYLDSESVVVAVAACGGVVACADAAAVAAAIIVVVINFVELVVGVDLFVDSARHREALQQQRLQHQPQRMDSD